MGHIYDDHGVVSIEGRRESFIVHASYGYKQAERPGDNVRLDGFNWTIHALYADHVCLHRLDVPNMNRDVLIDELVVIDDSDKAECSFAESWREWQPEFASEDLDDLIAALVDYRESTRS